MDNEEKLEENKKETVINLLEQLIEKIKNDGLENKGISVTTFCKYYGKVAINSKKALKWLDDYGYTNEIDKNQRIVTKKGSKFLNQGIKLRIDLNSSDIVIQKYPLIPLESEKYFIKIFNMDNFR